LQLKTEDLKIVSDSNDQKIENEQTGGGQNSVPEKELSFTSDQDIDRFVSKVALKLAEQYKLNDIQKLLLEKQDSPIPCQTGRGSNDLLPPVANYVENNISQPTTSDIINVKSKQHDNFDDKKLIELVSEKFKNRAKILLQKIIENPLQIDFNSKGEIFIDTQSVPESNIYQIFPELFIRKKKKYLPGLSELATKIAFLNWGHLINRGITKGLKRPRNYKIHNNTEHSLKEFKNWWYMSM